MRFACVQVTPENARAVLGGHIHGWLKEYHLPGHGAPFWVTVAEQMGVVVGAHAFEVFGTRARGYTLQSFATYAIRRVRGFGVGSQLWAHSLAFTEVPQVQVTIASHEGAALIERVRAAHPEVCFSVAQSYV